MNSMNAANPLQTGGGKEEYCSYCKKTHGQPMCRYHRKQSATNRIAVILLLVIFGARAWSGSPLLAAPAEPQHSIVVKTKLCLDSAGKWLLWRAESWKHEPLIGENRGIKIEVQQGLTNGYVGGYEEIGVFQFLSTNGYEAHGWVKLNDSAEWTNLQATATVAWEDGIPGGQVIVDHRAGFLSCDGPSTSDGGTVEPAVYHVYLASAMFK